MSSWYIRSGCGTAGKRGGHQTLDCSIIVSQRATSIGIILVILQSWNLLWNCLLKYPERSDCSAGASSPPTSLHLFFHRHVYPLGVGLLIPTSFHKNTYPIEGPFISTCLPGPQGRWPIHPMGNCWTVFCWVSLLFIQPEEPPGQGPGLLVYLWSLRA